MARERFDFSEFVPDDTNGKSAFGHGHPRGLDLRPDVPGSTRELTGVDLTHLIHTHDVAAAFRGGGGGNGGGGGGGGGTTFAPYTTPGAASSVFNITVEFKGTWTQDFHDIFVNSANRLADLIVGEIPNVTVSGKGKPRTVDDIVISAELGAIDGAGGILGQAGPTSVRTASSLPATAIMQFDVVDASAMGLQAFSLVVLHEMSHSLGFGSIWDRIGLVDNGLFTGDSANAEYVAMGGSPAGIPIEQDGGGGTAGSHWDEETFGNELLTGYLDSGQNYFTAMSAASFDDLGYVITPNYRDWADDGYILA